MRDGRSGNFVLSWTAAFEILSYHLMPRIRRSAAVYRGYRGTKFYLSIVTVIQFWKRKSGKSIPGPLIFFNTEHTILNLSRNPRQSQTTNVGNQLSRGRKANTLHRP